MTTPDRTNATPDLEGRLRSWMYHETAAVDTAEAYEAVMLSTRAPQRPRLLVPREHRGMMQPSAGGFPAPRLAFAVVSLLVLALVFALGVAVGGRLLDQIEKQRPLPGAFIPTGDIPVDAGWLVDPAAAVLADGRVLIVGGTQETPAAFIYDPVAGRYGPRISMPETRQRATATTLRDGRVLVAGGNDGQTGVIFGTALLFDPTSGTFVPTGSMVHPREHHAATLLDDGRVLITGGAASIGDAGVTNSPATRAESEIYDPASGTFSLAASLATGRANHTATKLPTGEVVVIGGYSAGPDGTNTMARDAEVFDPQSGTFGFGGTLRTPRARHTATLLPDGRVVVIGGVAEYDPFQAEIGVQATAEFFDPQHRSFTATSDSMTTERSRHSAILLSDGRILVVGGSNAFGGPRTAEIFDATTGEFQSAGRAANEHSLGIAALLTDGRVFIAGAGQAPDGGSELFDPDATRSIAATTVAPPDRSGPFTAVRGVIRREHTATRLRDGRVLIAGGYGGPLNAPLSSAEIFDPATGQMTATGSMSEARAGGVATMLADGRVLVAGNAEGSPTWAEVYDPASGTFGPATPGVDETVDTRHLLRVTGLRDGLLILGRGRRESWVTLDANTGRLGANGKLCDRVEGGVQLNDGNVLMSCGAGSDWLVIDPLTGATRTAGIKGEFGLPYLLPDGRVLLSSQTGGVVDAVYLRITSVFDPATTKLTTIEPPGTTSPQVGAIVSIDRDHLLVFGGSYGNSKDTAAILDTSTWERKEVGPMLTPRTDPTGTVLLDGRILITGGASQSPDRTVPVPPAAELFDPKAVR